MSHVFQIVHIISLSAMFGGSFTDLSRVRWLAAATHLAFSVLSSGWWWERWALCCLLPRFFKNLMMWNFFFNRQYLCGQQVYDKKSRPVLLFYEREFTLCYVSHMVPWAQRVVIFLKDHTSQQKWEGDIRESFFCSKNQMVKFKKYFRHCSEIKLATPKKRKKKGFSGEIWILFIFQCQHCSTKQAQKHPGRSQILTKSSGKTASALWSFLIIWYECIH